MLLPREEREENILSRFLGAAGNRQPSESKLLQAIIADLRRQHESNRFPAFFAEPRYWPAIANRGSATRQSVFIALS